MDSFRIPSMYISILLPLYFLVNITPYHSIIQGTCADYPISNNDKPPHQAYYDPDPLLILLKPLYQILYNLACQA